MTTEDEFVRNGVVYFPQAVEAVEHYAAILNERLKNAIEQCRPPDGVAVERSKLSWGSEQGSCWVFGQMTAIQAARRSTIEVGWWWKARHCSAPVIAYGLIYEGSRGLSLDGFQPSSRLSVGRLGTRRLPYIYAPSEPHDGETIQAILQESMRALLETGSAATAR